MVSKSISDRPGRSSAHTPRRSEPRCVCRQLVEPRPPAVSLDGNAKARIAAYARAWSGRHRQPGKQGPIIRAFLGRPGGALVGVPQQPIRLLLPVLRADRREADCARSTVAEALKVLEWAGVLTWQHRITRLRVRERDLFGQWASRWRVIRTSNAYVFADPKAAVFPSFASQSENRPGTLNQDVSKPSVTPAIASDSPLERALDQFGAAIEAKMLAKGSAGLAGAS